MEEGLKMEGQMKMKTKHYTKDLTHAADLMTYTIFLIMSNVSFFASTREGRRSSVTRAGKKRAG